METQGAATPPATREEREQGLRLYFVVRTDLALSRAALVRAAAQATWRAMKNAGRIAPERAVPYGLDPNQPKIALRVKSLGHLQRALADAQAAGLPSVPLEVAPGVPGVVAIGPATRDELPAFVRRLQRLPDEPSAEGAPVQEPESPANASTLWLAVREDVDIPFGKLAPQAGHGCWTALRRAGARALPWEAAGCPVHVLAAANLAHMQTVYAAAVAAGLPASFIIDNGHTHFAGPTPTVVGIGPCSIDELPALCRDLGSLQD